MKLAVFFATAMLAAAQTIPYPQPRKDSTADDYHGVKIADPYRWLENTDSAETAAWVEAENKVTRQYLDAVPRRAALKDRLTTLFNYERYGSFYKAGPRYIYSRNDGLQNQSVLYVSDTLAGAGRVLLDPNTLRADGTAALSGSSPSNDGKLFAYAIADAGSDWVVWRVRDIATGKDLSDEIHWSKFGDVAWTPDQRGFYYQRFPEPKSGEALREQNQNAKIYLHRLGQPQSADTLVYERPDQPKWMFAPNVTDDGCYLVIVVETGDFGKNLVFYQDLRAASPKTVELIANLEAAYIPLGNRGSLMYFQTTDRAPKGRIIAIDLARPARANWREIVAQQSEPIDASRIVGQALSPANSNSGHIAVSYLKDATSLVRFYPLAGGAAKTVSLPGLGTAVLEPGLTTDSEAFFGFTGYTEPNAMYRLDATGAVSPVRQSKISFDPARFEAEQVFYPSKDGTKIPMFLVHRKGLVKDGSNPTLLYGYGGFNVSITPSFSPSVIAWMEMGGIWASANLRGGAEYGDEWHDAGKRAKKQNVFDDFVAAGEYLVREKYTSTPKLAISGGSNGGLLVGAVLNQRPDLFGAAMPAVGVMDMLRFHKFTVGALWVDEYGSPDNPDDFKIIRAYSPLHNIKPGGHYPAVLITTSDHDDRVVPGHSFKYAATLQAAQAAERPVLIRIETRAGHGAGKPITKTIDEWADRLAFLSRELSIAPH
jgi:prolyl oligopeptidase